MQIRLGSALLGVFRRRRVHRYREALRVARSCRRQTQVDASTIERLEHELSQSQSALASVEGTRDVLLSQVEMFAAWESRERARLQAEAAMHSARGARAISGERLEEDQL